MVVPFQKEHSKKPPPLPVDRTGADEGLFGMGLFVLQKNRFGTLVYLATPAALICSA
ncbi:MAG: hypothetical protein K0R28_6247 [Paenibacillus sp.]|jgi:hypothetical protein|nr:hypothetical protein [Paenibacillus sp.]